MSRIFSRYNKNPAEYYGRTITEAAQKDDTLRLTFADGVSICIADGAQSCCERRYMRTDDEVASLIGRKLIAIDANDAAQSSFDGADREDDDGDEDMHEAVFLDVKTDGGMISFSFHNEHNGYYGGFDLKLNEISS